MHSHQIMNVYTQSAVIANIKLKVMKKQNVGNEMTLILRLQQSIATIHIHKIIRFIISKIFVMINI